MTANHPSIRQALTTMAASSIATHDELQRLIELLVKHGVLSKADAASISLDKPAVHTAVLTPLKPQVRDLSLVHSTSAPTPDGAE